MKFVYHGIPRDLIGAASNPAAQCLEDARLARRRLGENRVQRHVEGWVSAAASERK